ncbi:MAG: hypothetical protein QOJ94_2322 [Sphingomonadales bacterium]|jgi:hypothetical protein|nr:hypothetical protein [Sphingomonadales bacterium]
MIAACLGSEHPARHPAARIAVEAVAVAAGHKPSGRFTASRKSAAVLVPGLEQMGLVTGTYDPAPEEWGYRRATAEERAAASVRDIRIYYAKSRAALEAVLDAQARRDDEALGEALGYPSCCVGANLLLGSLPMTDMVRVARCAGERPDWRLNLFLTELEPAEGSPWYLVSHFPCSLGCRASAAYAEALRRSLEATAARFTRRLETLLRLPILLRDERDPPEERRYGNSGAMLRGATVGKTVFYDGWRSLREGDDLADARLGRGRAIASTPHSLEILDGERAEPVAVLDRAHWALVPFA